MRHNFYSAPVKAGTAVRASVLPAYVEVWHDGRCVARHERSYGNGQQFFNLEHYLEVLERKPARWPEGSRPIGKPSNTEHVGVKRKIYDANHVSTTQTV